MVITTLFSAVFFGLTFIFGSLSPLLYSDPSVNTFGSLGMWLSMGMVLTLYTVPLILYMLGINFFKLVMATFCSIGLLISATNTLTILVAILVKAENFSTNLIFSIGFIVDCLGVTIINIIWFVVTFKSPSKGHKNL